MPSSEWSGRRRLDVTDVELVGGIEKRDLVVADPDPSWPQAFARHADQIRAALGVRTREVEHVGSTSVPGLAAKPIIDILVSVEDITAEADYLEPLPSAGHQFRVREPGHRMLRTPALDVHIHIHESGDPAAVDYLLLRDHVRRDYADRELYERTKRELVQSDCADMNAYPDAKTAVIAQIKQRATGGVVSTDEGHSRAEAPVPPGRASPTNRTRGGTPNASRRWPLAVRICTGRHGWSML